MYGYRQNHDNGLMTNLDSISSSLSSIDTIGQRRTNAKVANSNDNLIAPRSHSVASNSLIWRAPKDDRSSQIYSASQCGRANGSISGNRQNGSEIYYNGSIMNSNATMTNHYITPKSFNQNHHNHTQKPSNFCSCCCFRPENTINLLLVPLLLLTILRQTLDFMGQIWLQIIINFFTIIIIIIALFGVKQQRISYLILFIIWSLFNVTWNTLVFCIHSKIRDVGIPEELLSLYTGTFSWWKTNGPGCLPYSISSLQTSAISMLKPTNVIAGCRIDYHTIEYCQALIHVVLTFLTLLVCSCLVTNIRRNPTFYKNYLNNTRKTDKAFRMNNLAMNRPKVNQDPYANGSTSMSTRLTATNSLRRAPHKASSRSSQHSVSSMRSARRRNSSVTGKPPKGMQDNSLVATPRLSTSSTMRSQKYGSISSRRSASRKERRSDISSLTYGTTSNPMGPEPSTSNRERLSSVSSVDYLPSYQPPHSSNANLLSSYGEISSVDSYNNPNNLDGRRRSNRHATSAKSVLKGNMNPTYSGSRSSISSRNNPANNYDDINQVYRNSSNYVNGLGTTHTFENRSHRNAAAAAAGNVAEHQGTMTRMHGSTSQQGNGTIYQANHQAGGSQSRHQMMTPSNLNGLSNGNSETPI